MDKQKLQSYLNWINKGSFDKEEDAFDVYNDTDPMDEFDEIEEEKSKEESSE